MASVLPVQWRQRITKHFTGTGFCRLCPSQTLDRAFSLNFLRRHAGLSPHTRNTHCSPSFLVSLNGSSERSKRTCFSCSLSGLSRKFPLSLSLAYSGLHPWPLSATLSTSSSSSGKLSAFTSSGVPSISFPFPSWTSPHLGPVQDCPLTVTPLTVTPCL